MAETTLCGRVGCGEPATCVLLMAAQDRQAWLVDPDHEFAPDGVGLCLAHADRITVPLGWSLTDERPPTKPRRPRKKRAKAKAPEPVVEPQPAPKAAEGDGPPDGGSGPGEILDVGSGPGKVADGDESGPTSDESVDLTPDGEETAVAPPGPEPSGESRDHPTVQLPAVRLDHPSSPANADAAAASVDDAGRRLSVVPGEDDPNKTFDFEDDGQGALWAPDNEAMHEPDERTPLLKRAFRVVRDD